MTEKEISWGVLTGIRPVKLARKLFDGCGSYEEAKESMMKQYKLSEEKASLLMSVVKKQAPYIQESTGALSIYIGIPFCPSKCAYCTFPSYQAAQWPELYERYTDELIKEMEAFAEGFTKCRSIYIGGGTPTSLSEEDFRKLMQATVGCWEIEK